MLRFVAESRDRLLAGRYRLRERIGRGGMGTVWWAYDEAERREVAVKEVHLPQSLEPREQMNLFARTNREAMAAGRLRHPGLIAMYDVVIEDSRPYLIMEYVAARSLEDVFTEDGPISPPRVAEVGRQLLAALRAAHAEGIVHRDVKPSNVLLETSGRVVLTDFGIATYDGATTLTQTGTFMGSPAYVAPEVATGERATPASDLWSLGATLYAAVEGRPPYDHETSMATLSALVTSLPDPPVRAGPLRPLLEGLLDKEASRRLSAERAAELLDAAAAPPPPPRPPKRPRRPSRDVVKRFAVLPAISGGVLALAVAAGVVAGVNGWTAPHGAPPAVVPSTPAGGGTLTPTAEATLPPAVPAGTGTAMARRVAGRAGTWPSTPLLTLSVPGARGGAVAAESASGRRLSVLVTCPAGAPGLTFVAYAAGHPARRVTGSCATATGGLATASLRLPAGGSPTRVRVRVRPETGAAPFEWRAGVYAADGG